MDMIVSKIDQIQEQETGVTGVHSSAVAVPTVVAAKMPPQLEMRLNSLEDQVCIYQ